MELTYSTEMKFTSADNVQVAIILTNTSKIIDTAKDYIKKGEVIIPF